MTEEQKIKRREAQKKYLAKNPNYYKDYYAKNRESEEFKEKHKQVCLNFRKGNPDYDKEYRAKWAEQNPKRIMLRSAKSRSQRDGINFNLTDADFDIPDTCPVLGIPLFKVGGRTDNSPSLDRIDNDKGYEKGNVCVISWRANQLKSNGTAEEHRLIAEYMKEHLD